MDRMKFYEIECLFENLWMKNKESWEQSRLVAYVTAQCQSTKKLNMKDIITFPWEKEYEKEEFTQEERESILQEMKAMEKELNKK